MMHYHYLFYIIIAIIVLQYLIDAILEYLNAQKYNEPLPNELSDVFDQNEYQKSQQYKKELYRFGRFSGLFNLLVTLCFLALGGFEWIDSIANQLTDGKMGQAFVFFGMLGLANSLLSLPFSYYHTFVLEEKFGFNKTTKKVFFSDLAKGLLMGALIGGVLLTMVIWFFETTGRDFWLLAWLVISLLTIFFNLFYSKLIVPLFNTQTPLEPGTLKSAIESYAQKVGFELDHIFVLDGSKRSTKSNAYFSGFGKQKRITLYDTLINDLDEDEIVAVLAHEVGHYKKKHIIFNLIVSVLMTGITLCVLSLFVNNPVLSFAIGVSTPSLHTALVGFVLIYGPITTLTSLAMNYISRKFEFQADDYAKATFGANPLITSLKKLSKNNLSNLTPHPAYVFFNYSHPPLAERIRNLKA